MPGQCSRDIPHQTCLFATTEKSSDDAHELGRGNNRTAHCHSDIGIVYIDYLETNTAEDPNIYIEFAVPSSKFCVHTYTAAVQCAHKCLLQTHQLCMQTLFSSYCAQLLCLQCIHANWTHSSCAF